MHTFFVEYFYWQLFSTYSCPIRCVGCNKWNSCHFHSIGRIRRLLLTYPVGARTKTWLCSSVWLTLAERWNGTGCPSSSPLTRSSSPRFPTGLCQWRRRDRLRKQKAPFKPGSPYVCARCACLRRFLHWNFFSSLINPLCQRQKNFSSIRGTLKFNKERGFSSKEFFELLMRSSWHWSDVRLPRRTDHDLILV